MTCAGVGGRWSCVLRSAVAVALGVASRRLSASKRDLKSGPSPCLPGHSVRFTLCAITTLGDHFIRKKWSGQDSLEVANWKGVFVPAHVLGSWREVFE